MIAEFVRSLYPSSAAPHAVHCMKVELTKGDLVSVRQH